MNHSLCILFNAIKNVFLFLIYEIVEFDFTILSFELNVYCHLISALETVELVWSRIQSSWSRTTLFMRQLELDIYYHLISALETAEFVWSRIIEFMRRPKSETCIMPEYKLIYFNTEGRAEIIRWIFAYAGIPYVDKRVEIADWPELKKLLPDGELPILMVDDYPLPQSLAIVHYVAKQAGLIPEDDYEAAYIIALTDVCKELLEEVAHKVLYTQAEPAEKQRILTEEIIPSKFNPHLAVMEERFASTKWFISEKITWGDLVLCHSVMRLMTRVPDLLKNYPNVRKHFERVKALPAIKKWISTRPASLGEEEWMNSLRQTGIKPGIEQGAVTTYTPEFIQWAQRLK